MKKLLFNFMYLCIGVAFFTGCSSDDTILQSDPDTDNVSLRHSLVIQPANNVDNLSVSIYPDGLPIPPYYFPAGYRDTGIPTTELNVHAWTNSGYRMNTLSILKFNILTYIKTTNRINRATLKLKSIPNSTVGQSANSGSANAFYVQQIASYFTAGSIINSGLPAIRNQVTVPHTNSPMLDLDIDVTTLVRDMVNNNRDYGFILRLANETAYNNRHFCSASYSNASMRPSLVIDFD